MNAPTLLIDEPPKVAPLGAAQQEASERRGASARRMFWLFLIAFACRVAFSILLASVAQKAGGLSHGSDGYEHIAQTVVAGHGYRFAPELCETMYLLPVYPLFLASIFFFTGVSLLAAQIAHAIVDALTCMLVYRLGRPLGEKAAFAAGLLYAFNPGAWVGTSRYLTEPLFVLLTMLFIAFFASYLARGRVVSLLGAGASLALAVLCKSVAGALPVFLLPFALCLPALRGQRVRALSGLSICMLIVGLSVLPWIYRNYRLTGELVYPSTSGGLALYTATVYASHPSDRIRDLVHQAAAEVSEIATANNIRTDPRDSYPRWFYSSQDELRLDRITVEEATRRLAADRMGYVRHVAGNLWRFWFGAPTSLSTLASLLINGPPLLFATIGLLFSRWWRWPGISVWLCVAAYLFLGHVTVLAVVRYSLTVMPLVCLLAADPLVRAWEALAARRKSAWSTQPA